MITLIDLSETHSKRYNRIREKVLQGVYTVKQIGDPNYKKPTAEEMLHNSILYYAVNTMADRDIEDFKKFLKQRGVPVGKYSYLVTLLEEYLRVSFFLVKINFTNGNKEELVISEEERDTLETAPMSIQEGIRIVKDGETTRFLMRNIVSISVKEI